MRINFISCTDTRETCAIYVQSDKEEIRLGNETDDVINELLNSFLNNFQKEDAALREGSGFVCESVHLLSYNFHKQV